MFVTNPRAAWAPAPRDLSQLVLWGGWPGLGATPATRYYLDIPMRRVPRFEIDTRGAIRET
jgi:hypothetical protein